MAKYLDSAGLSYLWEKIKTLVSTAKIEVGNYTINGKKISSNPTLTKSDVGLTNVTNDAQVKRSEMGVPNGVATLDASRKVPASQLPAYVDDVLEYGGNITVAAEDIQKTTTTSTGTVMFNTTTKTFVMRVGTTLYNAWAENTQWGETGTNGVSPASGKIYVNTANNRTYRWSGTALTEISASLALGETSSTAYAGDKGKATTDKVNAIYDGDLPLVTPVISVTWTAVKADGTTAAIGPFSNISTSTSTNVELEKGWRVGYNATYKWTAAAGKKNPTAVNSATNNTFKNVALPASGVNSSAVNLTATASAGLTTTTTLRTIIQAPKAGLMVSSDKVVPATGNDTAQATATVTFKSGLYYGTSSSDTITQEIIATLAGKQLVTSKAATINGVTADATKYYIIAYPKALGALTGIIQDGATPVLTAFTRLEVSFMNAAGFTETFYVYRSNNKGAFTNVSLKLS